MMEYGDCDESLDGESTSAEDREELEQRLYSLIHYEAAEGEESYQDENSYVESLSSKAFSQTDKVVVETRNDGKKQEGDNCSTSSSSSERDSTGCSSVSSSSDSDQSEESKVNATRSIKRKGLSKGVHVVEISSSSEDSSSEESLVEFNMGNHIDRTKLSTEKEKDKGGQTKKSLKGQSSEQFIPLHTSPRKEFIRVEEDRDSLTTEDSLDTLPTEESSQSDDDLTSMIKDAGFYESGQFDESSSDSLSAEDVVLISDDDQEKLDLQVHSHQDSGVQSSCDTLGDDFTLENIHSQLPDDGWHVTVHDRSTKVLRGRYYQPATPINVRCHNCDQRGHLSKICPKPKKVSSCILCGVKGHRQYECPNQLCFNCNQPGHIGRDCPSEKVRWFSDCNRCWMLGHASKDCPQLWRQFHATTSMGKLVAPRCTDNERKCCYNCAKKGHFGHECPSTDKYKCPAQPFILEYDKLKDLYRHDILRKFKLLKLSNENRQRAVDEKRREKAVILPEFCQKLPPFEYDKLSSRRNFLTEKMIHNENQRQREDQSITKSTYRKPNTPSTKVQDESDTLESDSNCEVESNENITWTKVLTKKERNKLKKEKRKEKGKKKVEEQLDEDINNNPGCRHLKIQKKKRLMKKLMSLRKDRKMLRKDRKAAMNIDANIEIVQAELSQLRKELKANKIFNDGNWNFTKENRKKKDQVDTKEESKEGIRTEGKRHRKGGSRGPSKNSHATENNLSNASWESNGFFHERLYSSKASKGRKYEMNESAKHKRSWDTKANTKTKRGPNSPPKSKKSKKAKASGGFKSSIVVKR